MNSSQAVFNAASRSYALNSIISRSITANERNRRTVLASVIVSAKFGIPFEANSNRAFGLKMTDVLRSKLIRASIPKFGSQDRPSDVEARETNAPVTEEKSAARSI